VPPPRERRQDIPLLIDYFLQRYSAENGKQIDELSKEAMDLMMRHSYPGNVRELQNMIERAVVMTRGKVITKIDLPNEMNDAEAESAADDSTSLPDQVEALERGAIEQALLSVDGVQSRAAQLLGITERNLRYKLKKYGFK
jgi:two-component system NtrC family response regulator